MSALAKMERVLRLLRLLREPRHVDQLAEEMGLSVRSVYRYIELFKESGFGVIQPNADVGSIYQVRFDTDLVIEELGERWKAVEETGYEVSTLGRVRRGEELVNPFRAKSGHLMVYISRVGQIALAQLVARYFLPNPLGAVRVGYHDGDLTNVSLGNLYWKTSDRPVAPDLEDHFNGLSEKAKQVQRGIQAGKSVAQLAREMGVQERHIRYFLKRYDIRTEPKKRAPTSTVVRLSRTKEKQVKTNERNTKIRQLYEAGVSIDELATQFNISYERARQVIGKEKVKAVRHKKWQTIFEQLRTRPIEEVVAETGLTQARLRYLAKKHEVELFKVPRPPKPPKPFDEQVRAMAEQGKSLTETAARLNLPFATVQYAAKRLGLTFKRSTRQGVNAGQQSIAEALEGHDLQSLLDKHGSVSAVARELGLNPGSLATYLDRKGIVLRRSQKLFYPQSVKSSDPTNDELRALIGQFKTAAGVANHLGITGKRVRLLCKRAGIALTRPKAEPGKQQVLELHQQGLKASLIAQQTGFSIKTVYQYISQGVHGAKSWKKPKGYKPKSKQS